MRDGFYSWLLMLLFLAFVFQGDPNLWQVWHDAAMHVGCTK